MLKYLSQHGTKVILPLVFKVGRTPKQSLSILERCIIGWQLCVMYASLSQAWMQRMLWITVLGVKPSMTRNVQNRRDRKRQRNCTRRSPSPGDERRCPNYPAQRSPTLSVESYWRTKLAPFLDPPGFISWVSPYSIKLPLLSSATINCFILCFNFNMLKWKTFNKSLMFIHLYKVLVSCVKLHPWACDSNSSTPLHWRG